MTFVPMILFCNDDRPPVSYDFLAKKEVQDFISMMVHKYHFKRSYMVSVLKGAKLDRDTLARYTGRYKVGTTNGPWERYKAHVLDSVTLKKAKKFKKKYYKTLYRASKTYHVDMDYIVGFIGVESKYGEYTGDYNILDALTTLAFHQNRMKKFFKNELKNLFLMGREYGYDISRIEGSFAGAMGCVQQVPSVFRKYGMDFNHDGKKDPWDLEDCIGIIARFMHNNGWKNDRPAAVPTNFKGKKGKRFRVLRCTHKKKCSIQTIKKAGIYPTKRFTESTAYLLKTRNATHDDIYLGTSNFRILTRYNNATTYGMAIHLIAQSLKK